MQSKVKEIVFKNEWEGPNGKVYYHDILLENGDSGSIGAKEIRPDKLKVGSVIDYEKTTDQKGNFKIRLVNLNNTGFVKAAQLSPEEKKQKQDSYDHTQRSIIAQSSLSSAARFYAQRSNVDDKQVIETAKLFYNWVIEQSK